MLRIICFVFLLQTAKEVYGKNLNDFPSSDEQTENNYSSECEQSAESETESYDCLYDNSSSDEIVGGDDVDIKQFPYQVSMIDKTGLYCGGSILSEQYVLTAAHCLLGDLKKFKIRAGSSYTRKEGNVYEIISATIHPKYQRFQYDYDVGVIKTEKMTINGVTTRRVKLADSGNALKPGAYIVVTGWGQTANELIALVLQAVTLPVIATEKCAPVWIENFKINITERMLCAGHPKPGKSACHGDSGGPAVDESTMIQYGIVSFGAPDCQTPGLPNVYAYVPAVRGWIREVTGV